VFDHRYTAHLKPYQCTHLLLSDLKEGWDHPPASVTPSKHASFLLQSDNAFTNISTPTPRNSAMQRQNHTSCCVDRVGACSPSVNAKSPPSMRSTRVSLQRHLQVSQIRGGVFPLGLPRYISVLLQQKARRSIDKERPDSRLSQFSFLWC
jgi:hypothetical protein